MPSDGFIPINGYYLPPELDEEFARLMDDLQERYDSRFIDNKREFRFAGFPTQEERQAFRRDAMRGYELLREKLGDRYEIELGDVNDNDEADSAAGEERGLKGLLTRLRRFVSGHWPG